MVKAGIGHVRDIGLRKGGEADAGEEEGAGAEHDALRERINLGKTWRVQRGKNC